MVPATPKSYFSTPLTTVEQQSKLKSNIFHNWESFSDWKKSYLAMMTPEERDEYDHHLLMTRSKYLPMTEDVTKLTPEDQQEYKKKCLKLKRRDIR